MAIRKHLHALALLAVLLGSVTIAPLLDAYPLIQLIIAVSVTVPIWLSTSYRRGERWARLAGLGLLTTLLLLFVLFTVTRETALLYPAAAVGCLVYALHSWLLLTHAFGRDRDHYARLLDAVNAYVLVGFTYVALFAVLDHLLGGAFQHPNDAEPIPWGELVYFSFSTLTTTGYGDIVAVHPLVRGIVLLEQISGVLFTATLIGRILGLQPSASSKDPR